VADSEEAIMEPTAPDNALAVTQKTCGTCGRTKPIEEFRFRDQAKGARHSMCNTCWAGYHRDYRTERRNQKLKDYVEKLATDASSPESFGARTRAEAVLRAMLARFGGLERFADDWFEFIVLAGASGKFQVVQRSLEAILRLIEVVDRDEKGQGEHSGHMSVEEMQESLVKSLVTAVWKDPDVGVLVLEELGWKLEPPAETVGADAVRGVCQRVKERKPGLFARRDSESPGRLDAESARSAEVTS